MSICKRIEYVCLFCSEQLGAEEGLAIHAAPCGHVFHGHCITDWMKKDRRNVTTDEKYDKDSNRSLLGKCPCCAVDIHWKNCIQLFLSMEEGYSKMETESPNELLVNTTDQKGCTKRRGRKPLVILRKSESLASGSSQSHLMVPKAKSSNAGATSKKASASVKKSVSSSTAGGCAILGVAGGAIKKLTRSINERSSSGDRRVPNPSGKKIANETAYSSVRSKPSVPSGNQRAAFAGGSRLSISSTLILTSTPQTRSVTKQLRSNLACGQPMTQGEPGKTLLPATMNALLQSRPRSGARK